MNRRKYLVSILGVVLLAGAGYFLFARLVRQQELAPAKVAPAKTYTTLAEYADSINLTCQTDSDCTIKDVRNCCGVYPQCVNVQAQVDPEFVRQACEKEGMMGICGYPVIDSCKCVNNKCQGNVKEEIPQ